MSKPDFSHLAGSAPTLETVEYPLDQLDGRMSLTVRPATEANAPYYNGVLGRTLRRRRRNPRVTMSVVDVRRGRDDDRELFARHVVVGWSNVVDSAGRTVEFTADACADFLAALPDWVFDDLRDFCASPNSFVEGVDADELGKA